MAPHRRQARGDGGPRAPGSAWSASEEVDLDAHEAERLPNTEEQVARFDRMTRSAEALERLKPQELRALWLRAQGHSYRRSPRSPAWTYTKVNRCITEGRRSFLARYAGIESGEECARWAPVLSAMVDGEASADRSRSMRGRICATARLPRDAAHHARERSGLAALLPVPVAAAAVSSVGAGGHAEATGGLLARIHDALAGSLQERVAASAFKVQSSLETVSAAKVAAVAASAAALAGGGVAVQQVVGHAAPAPRHRA